MNDGDKLKDYGVYRTTKLNGSSCALCHLKNTVSCGRAPCGIDGHFEPLPKARKKPTGPTCGSVLKKLAQGAFLTRRMRDIELNTEALDDADKAFIIKLGQRK